MLTEINNQSGMLHAHKDTRVHGHRLEAVDNDFVHAGEAGASSFCLIIKKLSEVMKNRPVISVCNANV